MAEFQPFKQFWNLKFGVEFAFQIQNAVTQKMLTTTWAQPVFFIEHRYLCGRHAKYEIDLKYIPFQNLSSEVVCNNLMAERIIINFRCALPY